MIVMAGRVTAGSSSAGARPAVVAGSGLAPREVGSHYEIVQFAGGRRTAK
jgi:hypothetical protein